MLREYHLPSASLSKRTIVSSFTHQTWYVWSSSSAGGETNSYSPSSPVTAFATFCHAPTPPRRNLSSICGKLS